MRLEALREVHGAMGTKVCGAVETTMGGVDPACGTNFLRVFVRSGTANGALARESHEGREDQSPPKSTQNAKIFKVCTAEKEVRDQALVIKTGFLPKSGRPHFPSF